MYDQHALKVSPVDQRHAQKRLQIVFASLLEIFKPRMVSYLFNRYRSNLLGDQARKTLATVEQERNGLREQVDQLTKERDELRQQVTARAGERGVLATDLLRELPHSVNL